MRLLENNNTSERDDLISNYTRPKYDFSININDNSKNSKLARAFRIEDNKIILDSIIREICTNQNAEEICTNQNAEDI